MNSKLVVSGSNLLIIIFYILPLIVNLFFILKSGYLTGDHWHLSVPSLPSILTCVIFLLVFYAIYFLYINNLSKNRFLARISRTIWPKILTTRAASSVLLVQLVLLTLFGLVRVGSPATGVMSSILSTFNPIYGLLIILTLNKAKITFALAFMVALSATIASASLFPIFFCMCLLCYAYIKTLVFTLNLKNLITYAVLLIIALLVADFLLHRVAELLLLRNSMRSGDFQFTPGSEYENIDSMIRIALGRFNPLSAMTYLYNKVPATSLAQLGDVDIFYVPRRILDMVNLNPAGVPSSSISNAYNDLIIGKDRDWGTIMSPTGVLYFLAHVAIENFMSELFWLSGLIAVLASLSCPMIGLRKAFLILSSFQYLLSGDLFELINTIKSLLLWLFLFRLIESVFPKFSTRTASSGCS
jgi:hypothetical protein